MTTYVGLDILGASYFPSHAIGATTTQRVIVVDIKDPTAVAKKQGALASLASSILPEFVNDKVYDEVAKQLGPALKDKGVDADVKVVDASSQSKSMTASAELRALGVGMGIGAAGFFLVKSAIGLLTG
jgi:hypothetical protein